MAMHRLIPSFFDELIKIGVSSRESHFMQTRKSRRPIRASTLLAKEDTNKTDEKIESQPEEEMGRGFQEDPEKLAAMATDLRELGIGGVKRPPFPTEDSKRLALNTFNSAKKPGLFKTHTEPKHLSRPGPTLSQIAPKV
jgi:hypothetical protein